jgi:hypothetical protein
MTYHDYPLTLEERLENAFLSFNKEEELLKVIEKVCFDNGLDKESTWAIKEAFLQK